MKHMALIWDLDGTLLDTLDDLMDATNHVLEKLGHPKRSREEIRRFVGNGVGKLISRAMPEGSAEAEAEKALAEFRPYYDAHCQDKTGPYPGILEVLAGFQAQGYPMAVVSNKPDSAVRILCREYFGDLIAVTTGEVAGIPRKPAPDLVFQAAKALGVELRDCIYIGDSEVDIQTARNAGLPCLSVLWGFRDREVLERAGGTHFCAEVRALPQAMEALEVRYGQ